MKNKKQLRRQENLQNKTLKTLKILGLTGMLVSGSLGLAHATNLDALIIVGGNVPAHDGDTIATDIDLSISTVTNIIARSTHAGSVTITGKNNVSIFNGGELTLNKGNAANLVVSLDSANKFTVLGNSALTLMEGTSLVVLGATPGVFQMDGGKTFTTNLTVDTTLTQIILSKSMGIYANKVNLTTAEADLNVSGNANFAGSDAFTLTNGNATIIGNTVLSDAAGTVSVAGGTMNMNTGSLTLVGGTAGAMALTGGKTSIDGNKLTVTNAAVAGVVNISGGVLHVKNNLDNTKDVVTLTNTRNSTLNVEGTYKVAAGVSNAVSTLAPGTLNAGALEIAPGASGTNTNLIVDNSSLTFTGLQSHGEIFNGSSITVNGAGRMNLNSGAINQPSIQSQGGTYKGTVNLTTALLTGQLNAQGGNWALSKVVILGSHAVGAFINVSNDKLIISSLTRAARETGTAGANVSNGVLQLQLSDIYDATTNTSTGILGNALIRNGTLELVANTVDWSKKVDISTSAGWNTGYTGIIQFVDSTGSPSNIVGIANNRETVANLKGFSLPTVTATQAFATNTETLDGQFGAQALEVSGTFVSGSVVTLNPVAGVTNLIGGDPDTLLLGVVDAGGTVVTGVSTQINISAASNLTLGNAYGNSRTNGVLNSSIDLGTTSSAFNIKNINATINGNISDTDAGFMNVTAADLIMASGSSITFDSGSSFGIDNAVLKADTVIVQGTGEMNVSRNSEVSINNLNSNVQVNVSNNSHMSVKELISSSIIFVASEANPGTDSSVLLAEKALFLGDGTIILGSSNLAQPTNPKNAAKAAIANGAEAAGSKTIALDGKMEIRKGGQFTLGSLDTNIIPTLFTKNFLLQNAWGRATDGVHAVAYLAKPVSFGSINSFIHLGESNPTNNQFSIGPNGMLAVDVNSLRNAGGVTEIAAVTGNNSGTLVAPVYIQTAHLEKGSRLFLSNVKGSDKIKVLDGFADITSNNVASGKGTLTGNNILFDNILLYATTTRAITTGNVDSFTVNVKSRNAQSYLNGIGAGAAHIAKVYSVSHVANSFVKQSLDPQVYGQTRQSRRQIAMNLEAGLDIARAADAQHAAISVAELNSSAIQKRIASDMRNSMNGMSTGSMGNMRVAVWGQPIYSHTDSGKSKIKGTDFSVKSKTNTFGGIIGADLNWESYLVGVALNIGSGTTKAGKYGIDTKNKFNYVGGALYASYLYNQFGFSAVGGYTSISNDVKQTMAVTRTELKGKPHASVLNLGVEGRYTYSFNNGTRLIPSLGLEWYHYQQKAYTSGIQGVDQVRVGKGKNNVVRLPIGLALNKDFAFSNGMLTPEAHVRYIPAFGGKMNTTATLVNLPAANGTMTGISPDHHTGELGLALTGKFSNMSLSAGYDFQFSKSRKGHQINAMLRYQF